MTSGTPRSRPAPAEHDTDTTDRRDSTVRQHRFTGYLKQYAIQAKPTNTERTTPSNNTTMNMVLNLLSTFAPAKGSRALMRRRRSRLGHGRPAPSTASQYHATACQSILDLIGTFEIAVKIFELQYRGNPFRTELPSDY